MAQAKYLRLITPLPLELVAAIDDYRFENRRPSRSATVRELLVIALSIDGHVTPKLKPNLSARLREEINKGLDNKAVWAIIQPEFGLDDNKKGYVAGQRREMAIKEASDDP